MMLLHISIFDDALLFFTSYDCPRCGVGERDEDELPLKLTGMVVNFVSIDIRSNFILALKFEIMR